MRRSTRLRRIVFLTGITLAASASLAEFVGADSVTLGPAKDNTLFQPISGQASNGAGPGFFTGRTNSSDVFRRGLVAFDIAGAIPTGSTINSASLTLTVDQGKNGTFTTTLHRVLASWGEGASNTGATNPGQGVAPQTNDATWIHRFYPGTLWATAGGEFNSAASASIGTPPLGTATWSGPGLAADVQFWLDNPASNHGWLVKGDESAKRTARRFVTKEGSPVGSRPQLTIDYTPTEIVGACCLPDDSCAILTAVQCASQGGTYQGDGTNCTPSPCVQPTGACCFQNGTCDTLTQAECMGLGGIYQGDNTACTPDLCPVVLEAFVDSLPRPAVAVPVSGTPGGVATYVIPIQEVWQQLHRDLPPTRVWGYGGSYPGPTLENSTGNPITVTWVNDLRDTTGTLRTEHYLPVDICMNGPDSTGSAPLTVVHLHGGHVPPESDGYPEDTFLPGAQMTNVYPNNQDAATLWYHDHAMGITRLNVLMGLAGFYLIRDAVEGALGLPSGDYEIPIAIQDRSFNPDGSFKYPAMWMDHFFGDKFLVNGKVWPYLHVNQGKYRFRVLNGCNSRVLRLTLSSGDPFTVIGTEGGLLPRPQARDTLLIGGGERFDLIVDFAGKPAGTEIILTNDAPAPFPGTPGVGVIPEIMKFVVQGVPGHTAPIPSTLRSMVPLPPATAVQSRDFLLRKTTEPCAGSMWEINGLHWDDITERPVLGTTEIWRFANDSGVYHPMHMHLVLFQVLDIQPFTTIGDSIVAVGPPVPPDSARAGWKDTVPVLPGEMVRVIARFEDYTGKYPYHCHVLEHEDHEMMRQFEVVTAVGIADPSPAVGLSLAQNRPNPFGARTEISFDLPREARVNLRIFDIAGRLVRRLENGALPARAHTITWDGRNDLGVQVNAGIYIVRLQVDSAVVTRRMVRLP